MIYPTKGQIAATASVFAVKSQLGMAVLISAAMYESEGLTKYRIAWEPDEDDGQLDHGSVYADVS